MYSRRGFLTISGAGALSLALAGLPEALARRGWLEPAAAAASTAVLQTFDGLAAFVLPGDDAYSRAQGEWLSSPGGVSAGAGAEIVRTLDGYVPVPLPAAGQSALPAAAATAGLMNAIALQVDPPAAAGNMAPFASLRFRDKAEVFRRLETDPALDDTEFRFLAGILPAFAAFMGMSEVGVLQDGKLTGRPVGWRLTGHAGPADGWDDFQGYYEGRATCGT